MTYYLFDWPPGDSFFSRSPYSNCKRNALSAVAAVFKSRPRTEGLELLRYKGQNINKSQFLIGTQGIEPIFPFLFLFPFLGEISHHPALPLSLPAHKHQTLSTCFSPKPAFYSWNFSSEQLTPPWITSKLLSTIQNLDMSTLQKFRQITHHMAFP